jgi:hypothetical protein
MRRKRTDHSYKEYTESIISDNIDPWQLIRKDEREGFHRYTNTIVSFVSEADTETQFVENTFFPDTLDLNEEWVMYYPYPPVGKSEVYINTIPLSDIDMVGEAENIDDFTAGNITYLSGGIINSGLPYLESISIFNINELYALTSGILYTIDPLGGTIINSGDLNSSQYQIKEADFDVNNRICTIEEDYIKDSINVYIAESFIYPDYNVAIPIENTLLEASGLPYTVIDSEELIGIWNEDFDIDDNNYIGNSELAVLNNIYGNSTNDFSPSEWEEFAWADVNNNGIIDDFDYNVVNSSIPSAPFNVTAVVEVPVGTVSKAVVIYEKDIPKPVYIYRENDTYTVMMNDHILNNTFCKVVYDSHTDIYYGITNDNKSLKAIVYDNTTELIISDEYIFVPRWSDICDIIDIDIHNGHLFVMVGDGNTYRIFYDDIWSEYVDSILIEIVLYLPDDFIPISMSIGKDGGAVISGQNEIVICNPSRDKYIELEGVVYFNKKHDITDASGNSLQLVPQTIFNTFDSFAYSLGIDRPPGCDNIKMKEILYDFYKHEHGHDNIGTSYGITREIGGTNINIQPSGSLYFLPFTIDTTSDLYINEYYMTKTDEVGDIVTYSGDIGMVIIEAGIKIIPAYSIISQYSSMAIEGFAIDGNGDSIEFDYTMGIDQGYPINSGDIEVYTLADTSYLADERIEYIQNNEVTFEFTEMVNDITINNPLIYRNAETCVVPMDSYRILSEPVINTIYDLSLSGIILPEYETSGAI